MSCTISCSLDFADYSPWHLLTCSPFPCFHLGIGKDWQSYLAVFISVLEIWSDSGSTYYFKISKIASLTLPSITHTELQHTLFSLVSYFGQELGIILFLCFQYVQNFSLCAFVCLHHGKRGAHLEWRRSCENWLWTTYIPRLIATDSASIFFLHKM